MLNYPNDYPDKFERWLKKFKPEYLKYYERGHDKGEIDIVQVEDNIYHLYYKDELLGTYIS